MTTLLLFVLLGSWRPQDLRQAAAVGVPPTGSEIFIQTNGPDASIALGDWYSARTNGIGGGYHYVGINVPCRWPADRPLHIDLFSPEMNTTVTPPRIDEANFSAPDPTFFELYAVNTPVVLPTQPGPGAPGSLVLRTYEPVNNRAEAWERFYTLPAPVQCGTYTLRVATADDSENGWRLRFGYDPDDDPNNPLPPDYDNPDSRPGTGDEPSVSIRHTTYQHTMAGQVLCLHLYQFVKPGLSEVRFHNFDLDTNERVTYYPPGTTVDPQGALTPGAIAGSVSGFTVWNGPDATQTRRGTGDVVRNPVPGWWSLMTCVREYNQFNQEGITGEPTLLEPPPEPDMVLAKDDGRLIVAAGDTLTYTITFANQALTTRPNPGAAFGVVLTDTLPLNTTFQRCGLVTPGLRGACDIQGGQVVFTLDDPVFAGDRGAVEVVVTVNPDATNQIVNHVALGYSDVLGNQYPTVEAVDIDTLPPSDGPPTAVTLTSFTARDTSAGAEVRWTTGIELGTAGFQLLRASQPERAAATLVSPVVPAAGRAGAGASYVWSDSTVAPGATAYYWLVELEAGGGHNEFGPARLERARPGATQAIYLPLLLR